MGRMGKRIFDIVVSFVLILILFVPLVLICIIIKITEPKQPVFFLQSRYTINRRIFKIIKLRTMTAGCVTKLGKILRQRGIDEIPQLMNVLKGDMSIVGPRAHCIHEADNLRSSNPNYEKRFQVKAGITGPAQLKGLATSATDRFEEAVECDHWYCSSPMFYDALAVALTFRILLLGQKY